MTTSANSNSSPDRTGHVDRVAVKPPPFWKTDPKVWFLQLEAQFELANITADSTKFNYVVSAVDTEILAQVMDILDTPPMNNKYSAIKNKLIDIYSDSNELRLRRLLSGLELGDKKPSQLLNEMNRLGGTAVPDELLKTIWMQQLPAHIQAIITTSSDSIDNLAKMADKIAEIDHSRSVVSSACPSPNVNVNANDDLAETVKHLAREVAELRTSLRDSPRSPQTGSFHRQRPRSRTPRRESSPAANDDICWYHQRFQHLAKKCCAPCKYFGACSPPLSSQEN